ncbi:MAG: hypothetical protein OEQ13_10910 [Acidobacteriota bacterium]|nr:hypothetical protein [Acidobacteriota bacterium]
MRFLQARKAWLAPLLMVGLLMGAARPRSRLEGRMYENLESINRIVEAVSREEFERVIEEAEHLRVGAAEVRKLRHADLGIEADDLVEFRDFLDVQSREAANIDRAGQQADGGAILSALERMTNDACLACHDAFRREEPGRTAPALLMRSLLGSVQSMQRGLMIEDLSLVGREAREIAAVARLFAWPQVVGKMFEVEDPAEREAYRSFFDQLSAHASAVERASLDRDTHLVTESLSRMLEESCVACHTRHRESKKKTIVPSLELEGRVLDE